MTQNITPRHIRELLRAYYEGSATAADEALLAEYFAGAAEVDADLEPDRAMFRALAAARTSDAEPPADLERRILRATVGRRGRLSVRRRWIPAISVAAAVALLVGIGLNISRQPEPVPAASTPRLVAELRSVSVPVDTPTPEAVRPEPRQVAQTVRAAVEEEADPYIEITDSAGVAEYTRLMLSKLNATLAPAASGLRTADVALADISEKINNINIKL